MFAIYNFGRIRHHYAGFSLYLLSNILRKKEREVIMLVFLVTRLIYK